MIIFQPLRVVHAGRLASAVDEATGTADLVPWWIREQ